VNNVGGMVPGTVDSITDEQWAQFLNTSLLSYVWATRYAIPHLKKAKGGRILNVSGFSGTQLLPGAITTTLANAGIIGFSKQMAAALAPDGITVNNICPGMTNTESWGPRAEAMAKVRNTTAEDVRKGFAAQTMLGRWAEPHEIGAVAAFLVSAPNSYMTGTTVEVCGGITKYL
jgi:3-oxoacyl-[acyl-carrier protein] reductase